MSKTITFDEGEAAAAGLADMSITVQNSGQAFIERLRSGEAEAFDELVSRHANDIFSLAYRLCQDREEANDIVQETFLSAVRGISTFRGDAELKTWLFRIAVNHSRNRFRWWKRRSREKTVSLDARIGGGEMTEAERIPDRGNDPEARAISAERETAILRELIKLPIGFREAVVLCDIEGHSYEEVSAILGIGIGTVKSRIARGRQTLRERLRDF